MQEEMGEEVAMVAEYHHEVEEFVFLYPWGPPFLLLTHTHSNSIAHSPCP